MLNLDWTHRGIPEWRRLLLSAPKSNWLQTITLAKVLQDQLGKFSRFAALKEEEEELVGIVAVQEVKIGPFHLVEVFRGPVWLVEDPPERWLGEFATLLDREYPRRFWRMRRWLPEWSYSENAVALLRKAGFKPKNHLYETMWIDLVQPVEQLRKSLDRKWRNSLSKGERSGLETRIDRTGSSADAFIGYHETVQKRLNFKGRPGHFLREEILAAATFKELLILWAVKGDEPVAAVLIVMHGRSGSYRAGWTSTEGRKCNAHNVLLWDAVTMLKSAGYRYLDLGGTVFDRGHDGIASFKIGMNGERFKTVGVFG